MRKLIFTLFLFASLSTFAQENIFEIMERNDLTLQQIENLADNYFKRVGTERGSGYKQYQRWLFERRFHIDENGFFIEGEKEDALYKAAIPFLKRPLTESRVSYTWSELGPKTWTYTSGWNPGVGRITSVAVHPANESVIYVSSPGGGIWKTINGGTNWTPLVDFSSSAWMNVFHLTIDPANQNIIYAAPTSGTVIKSTNAGASWFATGSGPSGAKKIIIHPGNSSIVFATSGNGIYRSTDAGVSWVRVHTEAKEDIEFHPADANIMYASGSGGTSCVWRSTDNGVTWTAITSTNGITNAGRTLLGVSPANPNVVYAVQASGNIFGRMYKSTDAGQTYVTTITGSPSSGTNFFGYETNGTGTSGQATYDMAICVNPVDANDVFIAGIIVFRSLNGGTTFTAQTAWSYPNSTGYNHADVHALEWVNTTIYSGSDGGVYKRLNAAGNWIDLSAGLGIKQIYRIAVAKTDANVTTLGAQDNGSSFRRSDGSWVDWLGADGMDNIISPTNAAIAIGTSQNGSVYKTTNSGASRTSLPKPPGGNWVTPIVMHPTNHDTVYGGWQGIYRSSTGGSSWVQISDANGSLSNYTCLAVAPSDTKYIYGSIGSTIYRTSDGGNSWTTVVAPASVNSIFVHPTNPQKIYLACNSSSVRVVVSTDMGTTFTDISAGLPAMAARSVVVDDNPEESIYVGMNIGVYYRDNNETAWVEHATGLPLVAINEVEIQKSSRKLRVATYGRGVWETDLYTVPSSCGTPSNATATSITTSGAVISWQAVANAVSYDVEYKASSASVFTTVTGIAATSYTLTSLNGGTAYEYRVRAFCNTSTGSYTALQNFTTLALCPAPASTSVTSITTNSAVINWASVANASSYDIQYKLNSASTFTTVAGLTGTSYSLSGLSASSTYEYQVKANCASGTGSFTSLQSFTTASAPVCAAPVNVTASSITGTTSIISWNAVPSASYYYIRYKKSNAKTWIQTATVTTTSYQLTGLSTRTTYNVQVYVVCSNGSTFSTQISFKTANAPANPAAPVNEVIITAKDFKVSPVPAQNSIVFNIPVDVEIKGATAQIIDIYGRVLKRFVITNHNMQININAFAKGNYTIQFMSDKKIASIPFIKN